MKAMVVMSLKRHGERGLNGSICCIVHQNGVGGKLGMHDVLD